jgi:hypothetical protein
MPIEVIYAIVVTVAAVFGAIAGRVFAVEAENAVTAVFAASYVGAGAGLVSALPLSSLLILVAALWTSPHDFSSVFDALDVTGTAVLLGIASGAAGGFLISLAVGAFKIWQQPRSWGG